MLSRPTPAPLPAAIPRPASDAMRPGSGAVSPASGGIGTASGAGRILLLLPKILLGGLVLSAIAVMLYGVFMRYVMLPITDWLDVDPVNFFWVEEVGETTLAWLTMIGASVAVRERAHFALNLFTHRLAPRWQAALHVLHNLLIAAFGALIAWLGFKLVLLNGMLTSSALEISLGWLYSSVVAGGILMALYALDAARRPSEPAHTFADVRE